VAVSIPSKRIVDQALPGEKKRIDDPALVLPETRWLAPVWAAGIDGPYLSAFRRRPALCSYDASAGSAEEKKLFRTCHLRLHCATIRKSLRYTVITHPQEESMNKSELVEITAKEADISKAAAEKALSAAMGAIVKAVAKGDTVTLVGFGTFKSSKRAARVGRNPQTGKELKIAATTVPRFTAGASFKSAVAGKKAAKKK
jgi:DNA-binding protein HU-beta